MPLFVVFTNIEKSKIPTNILEDATKLISSILKKPETFVTIRVHPDQLMSHGGSRDPCASVELHSIGGLGGDLNKEHSKRIADFLKQQLDLESDRFYIRFHDIPRPECGYKGSTF